MLYYCMSTRSNIKLIDNCGEILLYKHHDGYPEGGPGMINFLTNWLAKSGKSAEWMANQMISETECEVSSGLHGDIQYYYEVNVETNKIDIYEYDMVKEEKIFSGTYSAPEVKAK